MWSMLYQSLVDPFHLFAWFGRAIWTAIRVYLLLQLVQTLHDLKKAHLFSRVVNMH